MWLILLSAVTILQVAIFALLTSAWKTRKENAHRQNPQKEFGPQQSPLSNIHYSLLTFNSPRSTLHNEDSSDLPQNGGISVLIAAKNEAENLKRFLPGVLNQDFRGNYEVIVALDRCTDASEGIVAELQTRHPHLKSIVIDSLPEGWTGKK